MAGVDLTTVARLRMFGGIKGTDPDTDTLLAEMITYVSAKLEQYCSRGFKSEPAQEKRRLRGTLVPVFRDPVTAISSVRASTTGRAANLAILPSSQYEIATNGGGVNVWDLPSGSLVEINYTGGLAADTADIIASHPVLEGACKLQTLNLWQRHKSPDKTGLTIISGETRWEAQYKMLEDVKADLDQNYNNRHKFL